MKNIFANKKNRDLFDLELFDASLKLFNAPPQVRNDMNRNSPDEQGLWGRGRPGNDQNRNPNSSHLDNRYPNHSSYPNNNKRYEDDLNGHLNNEPKRPDFVFDSVVPGGTNTIPGRH